MAELTFYNSLSRKKEIFQPMQEGYVGMYVCGPTVYSDVHIGNVRTFVSFDVMYRLLRHMGYQVRYVRNITDVGHLLDDGEDRMSRGARLQNLEPMEVAQKYTLGFHDVMRLFNALPPSIEPRATGHIIEQIEMVQNILDHGLAYQANGSVYFDTVRYIQHGGGYGTLSGRKVDELLADSRDGLKNQGEKRHPSDFAIWMRASDEHIMRWNSPWSIGFPGWHLECSAMSRKYLGSEFDIHGGGNDLKFPHHENEIAQNMGACNCGGARYWLHTNMLEMNGRKMSKSEGNYITPEELLTGDSPHITQAYSPAVLRFFFLQAHYRATLDLSNDALLAADAGCRRLFSALDTLSALVTSSEGGVLDDILQRGMDAVLEELYDDLNTPKALARIFELVPIINSLADGQKSLADLSTTTLTRLQKDLPMIVYDVLGLAPEQGGAAQGSLEEVMDLVLELRQQARADKNWAMSDLIRDKLGAAGIAVKDGKDGSSWTLQ